MALKQFVIMRIVNVSVYRKQRSLSRHHYHVLLLLYNGCLRLFFMLFHSLIIARSNVSQSVALFKLTWSMTYKCLAVKTRTRFCSCCKKSIYQTLGTRRFITSMKQISRHQPTYLAIAGVFLDFSCKLHPGLRCREKQICYFIFIIFVKLKI